MTKNRKKAESRNSHRGSIDFVAQGDLLITDRRRVRVRLRTPAPWPERGPPTFLIMSATSAYGDRQLSNFKAAEAVLEILGAKVRARRHGAMWEQWAVLDAGDVFAALGRVMAETKSAKSESPVDGAPAATGRSQIRHHRRILRPVGGGPSRQNAHEPRVAKKSAMKV